jgi:methylated-DNA-[protein]-cysteine S-methyltransferase
VARSSRSTEVVDTPIGRFGVNATAVGVVRVWLPGARRAEGVEVGDEDAAVARMAAAQLTEYARGMRREFDIPLDWADVSDEHRRVLDALVAIAPYGHTVTYGELGARAGVDDPREVGVHMNRNPLPVVIPCHRVVAVNGLGGYGGGLDLKRRLLELEGALPPSLDLGGV